MISGQFDLIQVGETAMRDPLTGGWGAGVPLYVIADEMTISQEKSMMNDFAALAAEKFRAYMSEVGA